MPFALVGAAAAAKLLILVAGAANAWSERQELRGCRRSHSSIRTREKQFRDRAKKWLQSKKHGRKVRTLRTAAKISSNETTMNRTHAIKPNTQLPAPKRGLASFVPCAGFDRSDWRRDGALPID